MKSTITLPKAEYERLQKIAQRYELVRNLASEDFQGLSLVKDAHRVGKYHPEFVAALKESLKESRQGRVRKITSLRELD